MITISLSVAVASLIIAVWALFFSLRSIRRMALLRRHLENYGDQLQNLTSLGEFVLRSSVLTHQADKPLLQLQELSRSQHGEDALAWNLLGRSRTGFFIEAGAHDGVTLSNTFFLESVGWTGLLVEAHPELFEKCKGSRPRSQVVHAALGPDHGPTTCEFQMVLGAGGVDALSFSAATISHKNRIAREGGVVQKVIVPATSLNKLLSDMQAPCVDFLSLDVEGAEMLVLSGFDLDRWKPRILAIEDNSNGSDPTISNYLMQRNYMKILRLSCNDFYLRREEA